LRNLVLSAFPVSLNLPDPYLRNIRLEAIPEMGPIPPTRFDITSGLKSNDLGSILEALIFKRGPPSFLQSLKDRLRLPDPKDPAVGSYNLSAINAVVVYVGMSSVAQAKARSGSHTFASTDPGVGILSYLASNLEPEGETFILIKTWAPDSNCGHRAIPSAESDGPASSVPKRPYSLV
jgi:CCR4-NOT transcription complex subunit 1